MSRLWEWFVAPLLDYGFMRYGVAVAAIVGVTSAVLSCLLVVRGQALLGDAISHAVLLGVAVGWIGARHVGIFSGALIAGVLTGLAITYVERNSRVKLDAAMGILFTFTFALGLAIISIVKPRGIDLFHVLLGNVLGVAPTDLVLTAVSGGLVLVVVVALFKELHLWSFDPLMAQAVGLPTRWLHYLFTALLSATIVASLQAVGLVLVIAMLVTPGATAYLLVDRLATMMIIAAAIGLVSGVAGLYGSYYLDVASGPSMVIVASALFFLAFFLAPGRGLVSRWRLRHRAGQRELDDEILRAVFKAELEERQPATVADLAERWHRSPDEVGQRVRELRRRELLTGSTLGPELHPSEEGRQEGMRLTRAHRLLERYLFDVEHLPLEELDSEAARREHDVAPEVLDDIDRGLGRPGLDPHGHPIPSSTGQLARIAGYPLTEAPSGAPGRVSMVRDDREELIRAMVGLGILPQEIVTVLGREGGRVRARIGDREAELPVEVAERVFVVPLSGG